MRISASGTTLLERTNQSQSNLTYTEEMLTSKPSNNLQILKDVGLDENVMAGRILLPSASGLTEN